MEFSSQSYTGEHLATSKVSLGQLELSLSVTKDGKWAVGVIHHLEGGLLCRVQGERGQVSSREFPLETKA